MTSETEGRGGRVLVRNAQMSVWGVLHQQGTG